MSVMPLAKSRGASVIPAVRLLRFSGNPVAPCRRPVTRSATTKRISVRMSSWARARSSHRANKKCRKTGISGSRRMGATQTAFAPHRDTKTLFALSPSKKRSRVAAPRRTIFNSPRAPPLTPSLRSELQTDRHWKRRRIRAAQFF
jgi:hypothetical protein